MERQVTKNGKLYTGETYPNVIKFSTLGLAEQKIKLIPYITDKRTGLPKIYREIDYKNWLHELNKKGVYVVLWKGKKRITTVQNEYAKQSPQGALLMPYPNIEKMFKAHRLTRSVKMKGRDYLMSIIRGKRKDHKDGLLALINARTWNTKIVCGQKTIFIKSDLKEHEASELLTKKLNIIEGSKK